MDTQQQEEHIVKDFSQKMLEKINIRHNRYAPLGWKTMDIKRLISLMKNEIVELEEAISESDTRHMKAECVDIANYAMFIHEITQ